MQSEGILADWRHCCLWPPQERPEGGGERESAENLVSSATAPSLDPTKALPPPPSPFPSVLLAFLWKAQTAFGLPSMTTKLWGPNFHSCHRWRSEII